MRSASEGRPKIAERRSAARKGKAKATLAMMLERCNNAMRCDAGGLGTSIGRRVCRGVGFLDWESNGRERGRDSSGGGGSRGKRGDETR